MYKINIGDKFGKWIVIGQPHCKAINGNKYKVIPCQCNCKKHTIKDVNISNLLSGRSKGCGCTPSNVRHNLCNHTLYKTYNKMKERCHNSNATGYKNYGGRGIIICKEWLDGFQNFYDWATTIGKWKQGLTIERVDVNGNYCPENCTFIPKNEQARNRRYVHRISAFGEIKTLMDWCKDARANAKYQTIYDRIFIHNWDSERAITAENANFVYIEAFGERKSILEWSKDSRCNTTHGALMTRIRKGNDPETAITQENQNYKKIQAFGEYKTRQEWCVDNRCVVHYPTLVDRINAGWNIEKAMTTPPRQKPKT